MSDFDLTPPSLPGQSPKKQGGFLKKFFLKEEPEQPAPRTTPPPPRETAPAPEHVDLDEIKRKLGLDDEPMQPPAPQEAPKEETPKQEVKIDDWTSEAAHRTEAAAQPDRNPWDREFEHKPAPGKQSAFTQEPPSFAAEPTEFAEPTEEDNETPVHHDLIDQHLAEIDTAHKKIEKTLQSVEERPELPEWKLQDKEIAPEQYFILKNGQPVKSLRDLIDVLDYIDDSTFEHHVNEYRNDFANWIRDAIGESDLADSIQQAENRGSMLRELLSHERGVAKKLEKEQTKVEQVVRKRQAAVQKLQKVEISIDELRKQLEQKTKELSGERKRSAKLVKDKLDQEVKRRLTKQKESFQHAREQLEAAKKEYLARKKEYEDVTKSLADREKKLMLSEQKSHQTLGEIKEERKRLADERDDAKKVLKDAAHVRKQWEEMKKLDSQTKQNLEVLTKKEIDLSRHEETLRQREKKIAADVTKTAAEQEKLKVAKEDHAKSAAQAKKLESETEKMIADAEQRAKESLDEERASRDRIKAEMKKLEAARKQVEGIRQQIDKALAKVIKNKKSVSSAVALRKQLEESILGARQGLAKERKDMDEQSYKSYLDTKIETTPIGQPDRDSSNEVMDVRSKQLPIYAKVEDCRQALESKDLEKAKRLYAELREDFQKAKVPAEERSVLYTNIRELYDDIHLAMLG
jgi:hypothetical protein